MFFKVGELVTTLTFLSPTFADSCINSSLLLALLDFLSISLHYAKDFELVF